LSSKDEVAHALSPQVRVLKFDPDRITEQDYEVWHLQEVLFLVESFGQLDRGFKDWTKRHGLV
jgi:phenylalanine-4-hydroxylase